jgi:hypothetical protein
MRPRAAVVVVLAALMPGCGEPSSNEVEAAIRGTGLGTLGKAEKASCVKRGEHWDCAVSFPEADVECSTDWRRQGWTPYAPYDGSTAGDELAFACGGGSNAPSGLIVVRP